MDGRRNKLSTLRGLARDRQTVPDQIDARIAWEVRRLQGEFSMEQLAEVVDLSRVGLYKLLDRHPTKKWRSR